MTEEEEKKARIIRWPSFQSTEKRGFLPLLSERSSIRPRSCRMDMRRTDTTKVERHASITAVDATHLDRSAAHITIHPQYDRFPPRPVYHTYDTADNKTQIYYYCSEPAARRKKNLLSKKTIINNQKRKCC